MVTNTKSIAQIRNLQVAAFRDNRFVTPSTNDGTQRKRLRLSSPLTPHAIRNLRTPVHPEIVVETVLDEDDEVVEEETADDLVEEVGAEVELDEAEEEEELSDDIDIAVGTTSDFNLLVPQTDLFQFISTNFVCRECHNQIDQKRLLTDRIGCACNVFWSCRNRECGSTGKILAKTSSTELSGKFKKKHPELPSYLGDYDINRQVILACQQSGGGARMASTFSGLMSVSRRSIWHHNFTQVEELIGIAQIRIGKDIIDKNLQDEIALSPMDTELKRAQVPLLMDGGWDKRGSGTSYNSCSGRVVSVGGRTKKVCYLVYYSKRCIKCEKKIEHPENLCANPEKYDGSSKAMESVGSVKTVLDIWKNYPNAYCATIVTDEDATTRSKLSHCMAELVAIRKMTDAQRRYARQAKAWTDEEKEEFKNKYRNKSEDMKTYEQQKKCKEKFLSEPRMRRCFHPFGNNKTESIHGLVVNVLLPKRSYFSATICGRARTYLACSIDSLGFEAYYKRLCLELGIKMSNITGRFYEQHDRRRATDAAYGKKPERMIIRSKKKIDNIRREWKKDVIDKKKGNTYRSQIAGTEPKEKKSKKRKRGGEKGDATGKDGKVLYCKTCKNYGHQRRSSTKCRKNPASEYYEGEPVLCFYVSLFGTQAVRY